jgi:[ribosomal protein S5]-alanine N-acetyltransferase
MTDNIFRSVETGRVRLRCPEAADAGALARMVTPAVSQWLLSWPDSVGIEEVGERIKKARAAVIDGGALFFVIELKPGRTPIGWISVIRWNDYSRVGSVGYWMGEAYHGHGYMTEAARAMFDVAFTHLGLDVIEAGANPMNARSLAVMRRLGMTPARDRMMWAASRGRNERCIFFELTREAFEASRSTASEHSL